MQFHGTTICAVKRDGVTAIAGDGQVTMGESVIFKNTAVKVRRIYGGKVILGFAGSVTVNLYTCASIPEPVHITLKASPSVHTEALPSKSVRVPVSCTARRVAPCLPVAPMGS